MATGFFAPCGFGRQGANPVPLRREMEQLFDDVGGTPVRGGDASPVVSPRMYVVEDGELTIQRQREVERHTGKYGAQRIEVSRGTSQAGARSDTKPH